MYDARNQLAVLRNLTETMDTVQAEKYNQWTDLKTIVLSGNGTTVSNLNTLFTWATDSTFP